MPIQTQNLRGKFAAQERNAVVVPKQKRKLLHQGLAFLEDPCRGHS